MFAQKTIVHGVVIDKLTKDSIAFASIVFHNTTTGTSSNEFGRFSIETTKKTDSIIVSYIGYKKQTVKINRNETQQVEVFLDPENYNLSEVTIKPKRNPAFRVLDLVVANKKENNYNKTKNWQQEQYEKFEIYFGNYSEKLTKRKQFKDFQFMFQQTDSLNKEKPLLPIYMAENIQQQFNLQQPSIKENITIAEKATGESYEQLTAISNKLINQVNVYDNFFIILDKSFISPITDNYQLYYRYYLEDSLFVGKHYCFKIRFVPKFKEDLAFSGTLLIHDTSWAVKKIDYKINNEINLNYVKDFSAQQQFEQRNNEWFLSFNETTATISPLKRQKSQEFIVHRTNSYKKFETNSDVIFNNYKNLKNRNLGAETLEAQKNSEYWEKARHVELTSKEKNNYTIADTLNYVPVIKKIKKAAIALATGYWEVGKISIGQLHTFYSFNPIEKDRIKLGMKTSKRFHNKWQLEGYAAYGLFDKQIKYETSTQYVFKKGNNRTVSGASYLNDLAQLGVSPNAIRFDNIITSLTRTSNFSKLTFNKEASVFAERYWSKNISNKITATHSIIQPLGDLYFKTINTNNDTLSFSNITNAQLSINTRLSFNETVFENEFSRRSLGSPYPVINFNLTLGLKNVLGSQYEYQKLKLNLKGVLRLNPIGHTNYTLEAGKIFGSVPYPLLELHPGNQTLVYDTEAFNLMSYFEFASSQYTSVFLDHHFDGFIFNKIPLIKKAKLREVFSARAVVGNLDKGNQPFLLPLGMKDVLAPYIECSAGIENIFKVVRIDYIWRTTHLSDISTNNWSIKVKLYFSF